MCGRFYSTCCRACVQSGGHLWLVSLWAPWLWAPWLVPRSAPCQWVRWWALRVGRWCATESGALACTSLCFEGATCERAGALHAVVHACCRACCCAVRQAPFVGAFVGCFVGAARADGGCQCAAPVASTTSIKAADDGGQAVRTVSRTRRGTKATWPMRACCRAAVCACWLSCCRAWVILCMRACEDAC